MRQAILFDFDGVLVDSMTQHARAWQEVLQRYRIHIEPMEIYAREGMRVPEVLCQIFESRNLPCDPALISRIGAEKRAHFQKACRVSAFPEAEMLVRKWHLAGAPLGLVTGSYLDTVRGMLSREMFACFEVMVTAEDTHEGKPSPQPYLAAAQRLRISPRQCVVIENAPLGIQAARAAEMRVCAIATTLPPAQLAAADFVATSFSQVDEYLGRTIFAIPAPLLAAK